MDLALNCAKCVDADLNQPISTRATWVSEHLEPVDILRGDVGPTPDNGFWAGVMTVTLSRCYDERGLNVDTGLHICKPPICTCCYICQAGLCCPIGRG